VDLNGGCDAAILAPDAELDSADPTLVVPGQLPNRCYQFAVWAVTAPPEEPPAGASEDPPTYVSGVVRVLKTWMGKQNLYRSGVFVTQKTMTWCVAASVQMMINVIRGTSDHSRETQQKYIKYARKNDLYTTAEAKGTDAMGWVRTLARFGGGDGYHVVSSSSYKWAVRTAVKRLRQTTKPVGLIVMHSNHAWVLTGFEATADPALDPSFQVTALYVSGPLYPRQSSGGYDMPPNTRVSYDRMKSFLTRYYDSVGPNNPWEGTYVTIQP
jgi:hypothetical protein